MFDVNDAQTIFRHLFRRMGGHIVLANPDTRPYPFDP